MIVKSIQAFSEMPRPLQAFYVGVARYGQTDVCWHHKQTRMDEMYDGVFMTCTCNDGPCYGLAQQQPHKTVALLCHHQRSNKIDYAWSTNGKLSHCVSAQTQDKTIMFFGNKKNQCRIIDTKCLITQHGQHKSVCCVLPTTVSSICTTKKQSACHLGQYSTCYTQ